MLQKKQEVSAIIHENVCKIFDFSKIIAACTIFYGGAYLMKLNTFTNVFNPENTNLKICQFTTAFFFLILGKN